MAESTLDAPVAALSLALSLIAILTARRFMRSDKPPTSEQPTPEETDTPLADTPSKGARDDVFKAFFRQLRADGKVKQGCPVRFL